MLCEELLVCGDVFVSFQVTIFQDFFFFFLIYHMKFQLVWYSCFKKKLEYLCQSACSQPKHTFFTWSIGDGIFPIQILNCTYVSKKNEYI
jgi:hypothetical protein